LSNQFIKIQNALTFVNNSFLIRKIKKISSSIKPKTLLIIRLDAIGDYILFRNYLKAIRGSKRFSGYTISLCGNIIWKDIAETFDKKFVDEFIWMDRNKFNHDRTYRYELLKQIKLSGFETVVDMAYSREILYGDTIVKASGAKTKVGSEGAKDKHVTWKRKIFSKDVYTEIIPADSNDTFEFLRNKEFISRVIKEEIHIKRPMLDTSGIMRQRNISAPYAVLFFGASTANKIWNIESFIKIAQFLVSEYNLNIVLAGGKKEKDSSGKFVTALPAGRVIDLCAVTSIPELAGILSRSAILISNESMATHLAASVDKAFICISNGERFIRFHPYPREIFDKAFYIYPEEISANIENPEYMEKFRFGSGLDINSISVEKVKEAIKKVL